MVKITGWNAPNGAQSITINGAFISATCDGQPHDIRTVEMVEWYDEKHRAVMAALYTLEAALAELID